MTKMLLAGLDDELPAHLAAAVFGLQITVKGECTNFVSAEFEGHRLTGADALRDPVGVHGPAVRDVLGPQVDPHHVVLGDLDASGFERVSAGGDREGMCDWTLILCADRRTVKE